MATRPAQATSQEQLMPSGALRKKDVKTACTVLAALGVALLLSAAALAAHPTPGAHYTGKTSQNYSLSVDVSSDGARVLHPQLYLITKCNTGIFSYAGASAHDTATATTKVSSQGRFVLRFRERASTSSGEAHAKFTLSGHFTTSTQASGTAAVTVHYPAGVRCSAHNVHFSLTA